MFYLRDENTVSKSRQPSSPSPSNTEEGDPPATIFRKELTTADYNVPSVSSVDPTALSVNAINYPAVASRDVYNLHSSIPTSSSITHPSSNGDKSWRSSSTSNLRIFITKEDSPAPIIEKEQQQVRLQRSSSGFFVSFY